jgi:hypothetical protein
MARRRISRADACNILARVGVQAAEDFHALSTSKVSALVDEARRVGYRKSKSAPGSRGRMFHQYLQRLCR